MKLSLALPWSCGYCRFTFVIWWFYFYIIQIRIDKPSLCFHYECIPSNFSLLIGFNTKGLRLEGLAIWLLNVWALTTFWMNFDSSLGLAKFVLSSFLFSEEFVLNLDCSFCLFGRGGLSKLRNWKLLCQSLFDRSK